MDKLSVHHGQHNGVSKPPVQHHHRKGNAKRKGGGGGGKGIKVVYISSPVMLTASAEEFRTVVQELTGRYSNVADHDAPGGPSYYSSSSSSSASYGRASTTTTGGSTGAAGASALPPAMVPEYMAAAGSMLPPFQSLYDQTGGVGVLYGQDYCW